MTTTTLVRNEGPAEESPYKAAMAAFAEIAAGLNEELPLDDLLHLLCEKLCLLLEIERCESGLFRGRVAHYKLDVDDVIQRYVAAGIPGSDRQSLERGGSGVLLLDE